MCYYIRNEIWTCWGSNTHGENDIGFNPKNANRKVVTASIGRNYVCLVLGSRSEYRTEVLPGCKLSCYGDNRSNQSVVPRHPVNFHVDAVAVSAGDWHTCAIKYGGLVGCWGLSGKGQADVGDWRDQVVSLVEVKNTSTCLLIGMKLTCFGALSLHKSYETDNVDYYSYLQLGYNHVCLFIDNLYCYGDNEFGQINTPDYSQINDLIMSSDANHTCTINSSDPKVLNCFGQNDENQSYFEIETTTYMEVVTGAKHTCTLYIHYYIQCWGSEEYGVSIVPDNVVNFVHKFSVGGFFSCYLRNANITCFGKTNKGKIDEIPEYFYKRTEEMSAGFNHICAIYLSIKYNKSVIDCWGLKEKDLSLIKPPMSIYNGNFNFISKISSGYKFSCIVSFKAMNYTDGLVDVVQCWGLATFGQLDTPAALSAPNRTTRVLSVGVNHACATNDLHDLYCWGSNEQGQRAIPPHLNRYVVRVSAGNYHTCATSLRVTMCWGLNTHGQSSVPAELRINYVVAGSNHSCGFDNKSRMKCWGSNKYKQLVVPRDYYSDSRDFELGERHTCANNDQGHFQCWGDDEYGQVTLPTQ